MKPLKYLYFLLVAAVLTSCGFGSYPSGGGNTGGGQQKQPPSGGSTRGRSADVGVSVNNVRLTNNYTILEITYYERGQPKYDQNNRQIATANIAFHAEARLVAANGAREFRFIKAEGIPIEPQRRNTFPGDRVDFLVYFERLDKGLENFDLFECNDYDHIICWNVYNLVVNNPSDAVVTNTPPPAPQPVPPTNTPPTDLPKKSGKVGEVETKPAPLPTPAPVITPVTVSGMVRDAKTNRPVSATIDYKLSSSKISVDSVQSFASTGTYKMSLAKGQIYTYVASAKGYLVANDILDLSKATNGQKITKDILLTPLTVGDKITLKNIYFEVSKSDLLAASFAELDKLNTMMQDNPQMAIRLEGHTDIIGDKEANLELSQDRVRACQQYLVKKGIGWDRIEAVGYGDTRPIVKKGTDDERKVNRRVEFVILKL